jgi:hypothetical protein
VAWALDWECLNEKAEQMRERQKDGDFSDMQDSDPPGGHWDDGTMNA